MHGGGPRRDGIYASGISAGQWALQYVSVIVALNDIGAGDGATCLVPASHKSELRHPAQVAAGGTSTQAGVPASEITTAAHGHSGLQEIFLKAGDAVLFNDNCLHGSLQRTNQGERRTLVFRYLPSVYGYRWNYSPSTEVIERLSVRQRTLLLANRGVETNSPDGNNPQQIALAAVGRDPSEAGLAAAAKRSARL